jgi:hypothetical protein
MHVRTTLNLDAELVRLAWHYTGIEEKTALIHKGLRALIRRGAAKRLAELGGTMPGFGGSTTDAMTLVDTSVWVRHCHAANPTLLATAVG